MRHYPKPTPNFVDPISKTPLYFVLGREVARLNQQIQNRELQDLTGNPVIEPLDGAIYSPEMNLVYPVFPSDIACFLIGRAIATEDVKSQPDLRERITNDTEIPDQEALVPEEAYLNLALSEKAGFLMMEGAPLEMMRQLLQMGDHIWLTTTSHRKAKTWRKELREMEQESEIDADVHHFLADPAYLPLKTESLEAIWHHTLFSDNGFFKPIIPPLSNLLKSKGWLWLALKDTGPAEGQPIWKSWFRDLPAPVKQVSSMLIGAGTLPLGMANQALRGHKPPVSLTYLRQKVKTDIAATYRTLFEPAASSGPQVADSTLVQAGLRIEKTAQSKLARGRQQWFLLKKG